MSVRAVREYIICKMALTNLPTGSILEIQRGVAGKRLVFKTD